MKEQIEKMAKVLNECCNNYDKNGNHLGNKCWACAYWDDTNGVCGSYNTKEATALYNAGYRKQSEGEWEQSGLSNPKCSLCRTYNYEKSNFCPNCGARMKGADT